MAHGLKITDERKSKSISNVAISVFAAVDEQCTIPVVIPKERLTPTNVGISIFAAVDEQCTIPVVIPKERLTPTLPRNENEFHAMIQKGLIELEMKRRNSARSSSLSITDEARGRLQTM